MLIEESKKECFFFQYFNNTNKILLVTRSAIPRARYLLFETAHAHMLKMPDITMVPQASHRLPHRSKTRVRNVSAGSSVNAATVNVIKTSSPRLFTFLTWPSNTSDIAILRHAQSR